MKSNMGLTSLSPKLILMLGDVIQDKELSEELAELGGSEGALQVQKDSALFRFLDGVIKEYIKEKKDNKMEKNMSPCYSCKKHKKRCIWRTQDLLCELCFSRGQKTCNDPPSNCPVSQAQNESPQVPLQHIPPYSEPKDYGPYMYPSHSAGMAYNYNAWPNEVYMDMPSPAALPPYLSNHPTLQEVEGQYSYYQ